MGFHDTSLKHHSVIFYVLRIKIFSIRWQLLMNKILYKMSLYENSFENFKHIYKIILKAFFHTLFLALFHLLSLIRFKAFSSSSLQFEISFNRACLCYSLISPQVSKITFTWFVFLLCSKETEDHRRFCRFVCLFLFFFG